MAGISADVVPFHDRNDANEMWKPELKMTGDAAETMPARIAAAGRRMPNRTTVASQSRLGRHDDARVADVELVRREEHAPDARDRGRDREDAELHPQHRDARRVRGDLRRAGRRDRRVPTTNA